MNRTAELSVSCLDNPFPSDTEDSVRSVRSALAIGAGAQLVVLAALSISVGLGAAGWIAGAACAAVTDVLLVSGLHRHEMAGPGPADLVTRVRAALAGGVAALLVDGAPAPAAVVTLAALALVLDGIDGWLARRTGTASALGARFDMEVDAFLILILSLRVAQTMAPWAILIGLARYAYVAAWPIAPWLRAPVPPRYWRKVVAAVQGIVLTVAIAHVLPSAVVQVAIVGAMLLLAESFGRDVVWQSRHERRPAPPSRRRTVARWASTALGAGLVWFALLIPGQFGQLHPSTFLRIPVEALVLAGLAMVLPTRARQVMAVAVGTVLGLVLLLRVLDMGFNDTIDRPFNPVSDWSSFGPAVGVVRDSLGAGWADVLVGLAVLLLVAVPVAAGAAMLRLTTLAARHRRATSRAVAGFAVAWTVAAAVGAPLAAGTAARTVYAEARAVDSAIVDERKFSDELSAPDPVRQLGGDRLLAGLRGKDVLLVFVESYGRVAVQDSWFSPKVDAVLRAGTTQLAAAGFHARSAFLTSPTFGGISWLAHSTLQSGLWVDSTQRYGQLTSSKRYTLSDAFRRAGWRTVSDVPSDTAYWPEGHDFYHYATQYNALNVGYQGPRFSYARVPDQFTLATFRQRELQPGPRRPVMAEIDLVSSHPPWAPLPRMMPWNALGTGTASARQFAGGPAPDTVWQSGHGVQDYYGRSIRYSMSALIAYLRTFGDPNLVMVVLGDHQPAKVVSGDKAGHDVPISVISADPAVLDRMSGWGWQPGLLPTPNAPVWRMDAFRNRFLLSFSG